MAAFPSPLLWAGRAPLYPLRRQLLPVPTAALSSACTLPRCPPPLLSSSRSNHRVMPCVHPASFFSCPSSPTRSSWLSSTGSSCPLSLLPSLSFSSTSSSSSSSTDHVVVSPKETISILRSPFYDSDLILVGTNHISQKSADEVKETIQLFKPDAIMVELCQDRLPKLMADHNPEQWKEHMGAMVPALVKMTLGDHWLREALNKFYSIFRAMGFIPGQEFKVAVLEAEKLNCKLVLGDQPQQTTFDGLVQGGQADVMAIMSGQNKNISPSDPRFKNFANLFPSGVDMND